MILLNGAVLRRLMKRGLPKLVIRGGLASWKQKSKKEKTLTLNASSLGRRRREIITRKHVLIDLLSWRYAQVILPLIRNGALKEWEAAIDDMPAWIRDLGSLQSGTEVREHYKKVMGHINEKLLGEISETTDELCEEMGSLFSPIKMVPPPMQSSSSTTKIPVTTKAQEDKFLGEVCDLLQYGRYHLISKEEWLYARENFYGFSIPTKVKWSMYDKKLVENIFPRLYNDQRWKTGGSDEKGKVNTPDEESNVLLFHRGVGVDRTNAFHFGEKTDEIVRRTAIWSYELMLKQLNRVGSYMSKRARQAQEHSMRRSATIVGNSKKWVDQTTSEFYERHKDKFEAAEATIRERISFLNTQATPDVSVAISTETADQVEHPVLFEEQKKSAQHIKEDTTTSLLPSNAVAATVDLEKDHALEKAFEARVPLTEKKVTVLNFLRRVALQEPTYKDVVAIYRISKPETSNVVAIDKARAFRKFGKDPQVEVPNPYNIHVKHLRDVPMADIELLLPYKQVYMSVSDRVRFTFMTLAGLITAIPVFRAEDAFALTASPAWIAAAVAVGSYYLRVASRIYMSWLYNNTVTSSFLVENINASGSAALSWIAMDAQEQLIKEIAITYLALVELTFEQYQRKGEDTDEFIHLDAITSRCTEILQQKYSFEVHSFSPSNALEALTRQNIIKPSPSDHLRFQFVIV